MVENGESFDIIYQPFHELLTCIMIFEVTFDPT